MKTINFKGFRPFFCFENVWYSQACTKMEKWYAEGGKGAEVTA